MKTRFNTILCCLVLMVGCGGDGQPSLPNQAVTFSPPNGLDLSCEESCPVTGITLHGNELTQGAVFDHPDQISIGFSFPSDEAGEPLRFSLNFTDTTEIITGTTLPFGGESNRYLLFTVLKDRGEDPSPRWETSKGVLDFSPGQVRITYRDSHQLRIKIEGGARLLPSGGLSVAAIPIDGAEIIINFDLLKAMSPP